MDSLPNKLSKLRLLCMKADIGYWGTKAQLKERLIKKGITGSVEPVENQFITMKVPDLILECKARGLTYSKYTILIF